MHSMKIWIGCLLLLCHWALQAQTTDSTAAPNTNSKFFAQLPTEPDTTSETLMRDAITHFDGQRYGRSIELLDAAIAINEHEPLVPILYYYRAVAKVKNKQTAAAIIDYDAAIKAAPLKSKYRYLRGLAHFELGHNDQARRDFERTLAMEGSNADLRVKLGFLKQQEEDLQGAIKEYNAALVHNPNFAAPYYYRGLIYLQVLLPEKACPDLQKAAALGHPNAAAKVQQYCNR